MRRPCRSAAAPTSGGHPVPATLISRSSGPDLRLSQKRQMALATHLVGRAPELSSVDRLLAQVGGGRSGALELIGEPGIGKTRLLAELAARADARGYLVLSGRAGELELDLPFWVFVDALDEYVHGLDPHRLDILDDDVRAELATVFPSLAGLATGRS